MELITYMHKVTVIEKWNGKIYKTDYCFKNEQEKERFKKLCKDYNCLVYDHKNKNNKLA